MTEVSISDLTKERQNYEAKLDAVKVTGQDQKVSVDGKVVTIKPSPWGDTSVKGGEKIKSAI